MFVSPNNMIDLIRSNKNVTSLMELDKDVQLIGLSRKIIFSATMPDYKLFLENNKNSNIKQGKRQIIIATNSVDTGVTINNLKYILNIGYERRIEYPCTLR